MIARMKRRRVAVTLVLAGLGVGTAIALSPIMRPRCREVRGEETVSISLTQLTRGGVDFFCFRDLAGEKLRFILARGTVAPENVLWFCQFCDFVYPIEHCLVRRLRIADSIGREYGGCDIFHETRVSILSMNEQLRHVESLNG